MRNVTFNMRMNFFSWLGRDMIVWGNTIGAYGHALVFFVFFTIIFFLVQRFVLGRIEAFAEKTETGVDNALVRVARSFRPPLFVSISAYASIRTLTLGNVFRDAIDVICIVLVTYQIVVILDVAIDFFAKKAFRKGEDAHAKVAVQLLGSIGKGVVWVFGFLIVLSNLGVNVTSLLAGVGIGGIAVAFALQNILKDIFSSFSLYFEKPFSVGDYIVVGQNGGTVKKIGIKTTRLKSIGGEEIVIPNSELAAARIENYGKMQSRTVFKRLRVSYETSVETLQAIPGWIREIAEGIEHVKFLRAHLRDMGEDSLIFEYGYRIDTGKYAVYVRVREEFHLAIKKKFDMEGVAFAYPTRRVVGE